MRTGSYLIGLIILLIFSSCKKENTNLTELIPKNTPMVISIDLGAIKSKNTDLASVMAYVTGDKNKGLEKILNSGIDLDAEAYIIYLADELNATAVLFSLSDESKFTKSLKKEGIKFTSEKDVNIAEIKDKGVLAWKEDRGVFLGENRIENQFDIIKSILSGTKETSLSATNEKFKNRENTDSDIDVWCDLEALSLNADLPYLDEVNLTDVYISSGIDFEDGEILVHNLLETNEELHEFVQLLDGEIDADIAEVVPGDHLTGAYALSLDLDKLMQLLEQKDLLPLLDKQLEPFNIKAKELKQVLTGDALLTINDLSAMLPFDYKASLAIGVKDDVTAIMMLDKMSGFFDKYDEDKKYYTSGYLAAKAKDNFVVLVGPSIPYAKEFFTEGGETLEESGYKIKSGKLSLKIDKLPQMLLKNGIGDNPFLEKISEIISTRKITKEGVENEFIIRLKEEKKNSFSVLMQSASDNM